MPEPPTAAHGHDPDKDHPYENSALDELREELGDEVAGDFVADFLELLDQRLAGLDQLVERRRLEDAVTILLTIETSGLMVGAGELAAAAAELRLALGNAETRRVPALLRSVHAAAESSKRILGRH